MKAFRIETIDFAVTLLGVVGFLGLLAAARMSGADASLFDVLAFGWFFFFGAIKLCKPWR